MKPRVHILYASVGGNTAETANVCAAALLDAGAGVRLIKARSANVNDLTSADALLLGQPTWGDGDIHSDFMALDRAMQTELAPDKRLHGIPAAVFGGCDRAYRNFGRAVQHTEDRLLQCGATLVQRGLKIELAHNDTSRAFTHGWALAFLARVRGELRHEPHDPPMTPEDVDTIMGVTPQERQRRSTQGLEPA